MYTKTLLNNKKSGYEFPTKNSDINAETPSVRKRKVGAFSTEKQPKSIRQGSPSQRLERQEVSFDYSFNRTVSPLSVSPNRFSFSADMDEAFELAKKALNGEFPELPKKSLLSESVKINKKALFLKDSNFIQNEKQLRDLFYKINPDIKILKKLLSILRKASKYFKKLLQTTF